jgi:hypothetical protein
MIVYFMAPVSNKVNLKFIYNFPLLTRVSEPLHDLSHGGSLLTDSNIDAVQLLLLVFGIVEPLLVDDGVNSQGSLAVILN